MEAFMENIFKNKNTTPTNKTTTTTSTHCHSDVDNRKISEAAYYLAEKNGFKGSQTDYWLEAERQLKRQTNQYTNTLNKKR